MIRVMALMSIALGRNWQDSVFSDIEHTLLAMRQNMSGVIRLKMAWRI
jgi:hypothetical protein